MDPCLRQNMARATSGLTCSTSLPIVHFRRLTAHVSTCATRRALVVVKAADDGASPQQPDEGPQAVSLARRLPGPEITFVLAGFLKIVTIGGLAYSAPVDAVRTVAGKMSPYLMIPVGLVMCWVAKVITDNELQESKRFMVFLVTGLVFLYFGLYRLLYRYDPQATMPAPRGNTPGSRVAQLRAQMGDRDLLDNGGHGPSAPRDTWGYGQEGRQPSYSAAYGAGEDMYGEEPSRGSTATLNARNPARRHQRRL